MFSTSINLIFRMTVHLRANQYVSSLFYISALPFEIKILYFIDSLKERSIRNHNLSSWIQWVITVVIFK